MIGINTKVRGLVVSVGAAASLLVSTVSTLAHATDAYVTPSIVEYYNSSLVIQGADNVQYAAKVVAGSGCTSNNQSIDTLKAWQSLGQAALLSGKSLRIYYNPCGGVNYISGVDLNK